MPGALALYLFLLLAVAGILTTLPLAFRVRRLRKAHRVERTRALWGEARYLLFDLVHQGKLDVNSGIFRLFYGLQTTVLRRPEAYDEISHTILDVLNHVMEDPGEAQAKVEKLPVFREIGTVVSEEMRPVIGKMMEGTMSLIVGHSGYGRLLVLILKVKRWSTRQQMKDLMLRFRRFTADPTDRGFVSALIRLEELQEATL
jgi:hypothetical protein